MAVDVEELIITPFREVVERAREAIANAEAAQDDNPDLSKEMMKSAQVISKEGERALKRLQPLWDSQVEKHGDSFKDMISENDDLSEKRRVMEGLLYDFEDFIEADTFEASKFAELQAATRSFALDLLDIIKRMKIETKTPTSPVHAFPPLPPLPPLPPNLQTSKLITQPSVAPPSRSGSQGNVNFSLFPAAGRQQKPQTLHRSGTRGSHGSSDSTNLRRTPSSAKSVASDARSSRHIYEATLAHVVPARREERRASTPDVLGDEGEQLKISSPVEPPQHWTSEWVEEQTSAPKTRRPVRESIPENSAVTNHVPPDSGLVSRFSRLGLENPTPQSSVFDPTSPSTTNRTSVYSESPAHSSSNGPSPRMPTSEVRTTTLTAFQFEPTPPLPPPGHFSDGLMLADEQTVSDTSTQHLRTASSAKGFCDGAQAFRRGGYWDGLKQTMAYVSGTSNQTPWFGAASSLDMVTLMENQGEPLPIGRCLHCEYYHVYNELTLDKEGDSRANFLKFGLLYRMRFLIKSHIPAKTTSEIRYACLFCTHTGHTVHEGDATVFLTADQLLRHLSRHPQPLPEVPGVTVLYGKVDRDHHQIEDYDVHFPSPPAPSPFPDADSLFQLPTAVALKSHVQRWGEVLADPDGSADVLKFMAGAKIVGIEFPGKWGGKWCTGWHDGVKGPFPAKYVEIEGPKQNEISLQTTSAVSLTTRWKWDPPDSARTGWLTFGKNETIKNVGCRSPFRSSREAES
ncbi:sh3 domain containing protein [Colletotrichum karsti]|uniref:Sh3 domain containing protein n=1 Tax=Colletotrichum karsti TaxID=1095194 RepID=A0A9P6I2P4_9PEZI|nr:sh3 domain containing protein [Colletotrichum karsti]KAF9875149.1 sh3 domain containing protein [Colletotrichum karsti]